MASATALQLTRFCAALFSALHVVPDVYFFVDWAPTRLFTFCCTFELEGPKCFGLLCRLTLENLTLASGGEYDLNNSSLTYMILCHPVQCTPFCPRCVYFFIDWAPTRLLSFCCTFELEGPNCFGLLYCLALENLTLASGGEHGFSNSSPTYTILCHPLQFSPCCSSGLDFFVDWAPPSLLTLSCSFQLEGPKCFGLL